MKQVTLKPINVTVRIHNDREELLTAVCQTRLENIKHYYENKIFDTDTIRRIARELEHMSYAMFHLDMIDNVIIEYNILKAFGIK